MFNESKVRAEQSLIRAKFKQIFLLDIDWTTARTTRQTKKQKQASEPNFCGFIFVPCVRKKDTELYPGIVSATYCRLTAWKKHSPKKWNDADVVDRFMNLQNNVHDTWVSQTQDISASQEDKGEESEHPAT